jgi:metal-responsive CopG/Arc/MetJ family transcriptional regulator
MKIKTSITLSKELLSAIDNKSIGHKSRSDFIENALWKYILYILREEQSKKDLEIINHNSDSLNKEAKDVLDYQVSI